MNIRVASIFVVIKTLINPEFVNALTVDILSYIALGFNIFFIPIFFMYDKKRVVEGANDDLTGCFTSIAILKFMQDNDIRLENTEVVAFFSGSEEAGLRGAKAYAKRTEQQANNSFHIQPFLQFDGLSIPNTAGNYKKTNAS